MAYSDSIPYQIAQILEDDGVGVFASTLFVSKEPDSPDNVVTVYGSGGIPDDCLDLNQRDSEIHNFQVRVRDNSYPSMQSKMEEVRDSIEKALKTLADSGGTNHFRIWMTSLPTDLPRDSHNRSILTANFSCMRSYN